MQNSPSGNHALPWLVADIGGTNARFGLIREAGGQPADVRVYPCADYPDPAQAAAKYLSEVGDARPQWAAMAVATAITGDQVRMTNHVWEFSIEETRQRLALDRLLVLNDFTVLALSLPHLPRDELIQVGGDKPVPGTALALIGPGTGLGVSGLIPCEDHWVPLQGEGGHVAYGGINEGEARVVGHVRRRLGRVSAERLVSGPGLVNLYIGIAESHGREPETLSPADVVGRALAETCVLCQEALAAFCAIFGSVAGDLALTLGARGGVYIGGGITPRLGDYFINSDFRRRFEDKGRFQQYMAPIPCYVIRSPFPALIGAREAIAQSP